MKKNYLWLSALVLTIAGLSGCSSDEGTTSASNFHVKSFANTGCKDKGTTRGETRSDAELVSEYIEYKGLDNGYLSLNHVNACFNCGAEGFNIQATISDNVIKIEERYNGLLANCICPYDLYCEVGPLADGDYTVIIYELYEDVDQAPYERARFNISYKKGMNGRLDLKEW